MDATRAHLTWANYWWALAIRGVLAILFGVAAIAWPHLTIVVLVLLFGAYAFVGGIFAIVAAFRAHEQQGRWWGLLIEGIVGIIAGLVTFFWPGITALVLLYFIAAWALITGIFEIVAAITLRRIIANEVLLVIAGVLSVLFGIVLFLRPGAGAVAIAWLIGAYAIVFGVLVLSLALRLRHWR